jgi:hypothetical protein
MPQVVECLFSKLKALITSKKKKEKKISFTITSETINYLGINLAK